MKRHLSPKDVCTLERVRRFERTAWRYKEAYRRAARGTATEVKFRCRESSAPRMA